RFSDRSTVAPAARKLRPGRSGTLYDVVSLFDPSQSSRNKYDVVGEARTGHEISRAQVGKPGVLRDFRKMDARLRACRRLVPMRIKSIVDNGYTPAASVITNLGIL